MEDARCLKLNDDRDDDKHDDDDDNKEKPDAYFLICFNGQWYSDAFTVFGPLHCNASH